jgi:hypothetical protein
MFVDGGFSWYCRVRHAIVNAPRHSRAVNTKTSDALLMLVSVLLMMLSSWLSLR